MKKLTAYITMALSVLFLGSCGDNYDPWADPQSWPQEDAITIPGFTAAAVAGQDLAKVTDDSVAVFTLTGKSKLPEGYELAKARIDLTPVDGKTTATTELAATTDGKVSKSELQSLIESTFGRAPKARTFNAHVYASALKSGEAALIDAGTIQVVATPKAPAISQAYYVIGGSHQWAGTDKSQKFSHSDENVYDDPIFTITIDASFDNDGNRTDTWFAIADDDALAAVTAGDWSKVLGNTKGNGNTDLTGTLAPRSELKEKYPSAGDGSICMPKTDKAVKYKITLNMLEYTYTIEPIMAAAPSWYLIGSAIGDGSWDNKSVANVGTSLYPLAKTADGVVSYTGYFEAGKGFKLIGTPGSWNDQWGEKDGKYVKNDGGSSDIKLATSGWYTVSVDYYNDVLTVTAAKAPSDTYEELGLSGSFNSWGYTAMTLCTGSKHLWKYELDASTGDVQAKFLKNGWNPNWGGTEFPTGVGTTGNAPNIPVTKGKYIVIFNDVNGAYNFIAE